VRSYSTQKLEAGTDLVVSQAAQEYLALVDLETYSPFVGHAADRLDMMVHLQNQMNALTAFAWDVPDRPLDIRLILTGDHQAMERVTFSNRPPSASGTVRTYGDLCLVGRDRLVDCARNSEHSLLKGDRLPKERRPQVLHVPPGIFYVLAYYRFPYPDGHNPGYSSQSEAKHDYTLFLHHYPHPAPRVAPVRLSGGLIPWAGEETAAKPWGGVESPAPDVRVPLAADASSPWANGQIRTGGDKARP
jgi:hypothetical protein